MMLQLSGVHAHYGAIHALHGVDLSVQVGEVVTLIGANSAGWTAASDFVNRRLTLVAPTT